MEILGIFLSSRSGRTCVKGGWLQSFFGSLWLWSLHHSYSLKENFPNWYLRLVWRNSQDKFCNIVLIHVLKSCCQVFPVTQALESTSLPTLHLQTFGLLGKFTAFDGNLPINHSDCPNEYAHVGCKTSFTKTTLHTSRPGAISSLIFLPFACLSLPLQT